MFVFTIGVLELIGVVLLVVAIVWFAAIVYFTKKPDGSDNDSWNR